MRILLTGVTGYLGPRLARALARDGHEVHALARRPEAIPSGIAAHPWPEDPSALVASLSPDILVHLAAHYVRRATEADLEVLQRTNVDLGLRLVESALAAGVSRIVAASSIHAYGNRGEPANAYGASRRRFEEAVAERTDVPFARLIIHDVYGPDDPRRKLVNVLLSTRSDGPPMGLATNAEPMDLVHVDDVVEAFVVAATGPARDGAFAIRTGHPLRPPEIHAAVERALGRAIPFTPMEVEPLPITLPWQGPDLPGWRAARSLEEGLAGIGPR